MPARSPIGSVNDFVVWFANIKGSGSASANELFARSVLVLPRSTLVEERQPQMGTGHRRTSLTKTGAARGL